jgi:hypothetical protein
VPPRQRAELNQAAPQRPDLPFVKGVQGCMADDRARAEQFSDDACPATGIGQPFHDGTGPAAVSQSIDNDGGRSAGICLSTTERSLKLVPYSATDTKATLVGFLTSAAPFAQISEPAARADTTNSRGRKAGDQVGFRTAYENTHLVAA